MKNALKLLTALGAFAVLISFSPSFSIAEDGSFTPRNTDEVVTRDDGKDESKSFCDSGTCKYNGKTYQCGITACDKGEKRCGCACVMSAGVVYPKGYCGKKNPFAEQMKAKAKKHTNKSYFNLY